MTLWSQCHDRLLGPIVWIDGFERSLREHVEDEVLHVEKEADVTNYKSNICIYTYKQNIYIANILYICCFFDVSKHLVQNQNT